MPVTDRITIWGVNPDAIESTPSVDELHYELCCQGELGEALGHI